MEVSNMAYLEVVTKILEWSARTAPVELSFGYVAKGFCQQGLLIKNAPALIVEKLVLDGYSIELQSDGLHVKLYKN